MAVNPSAKSNYLSKVQINGGIYWVKDAELRELLNSAATKEAIESIITDGADANNTNSTIPTTLALTTWLEQKIAGLTGAMHFAGVTNPEAGDTPEERIAAKVPNPSAGDTVIDVSGTTTVTIQVALTVLSLSTIYAVITTGAPS